MDSKPTVVARLTIIRADEKRTIVEIHADATFHKFFHFFTQDGRRRSTKTALRTASRNEYLPVINTHLYQPGLDVIERQLKTLQAQTNPVVDSKLRIIKKRVYKKSINAAPDVLGKGLPKIETVDLSHKPGARYPHPIGKAIRVDQWLKSLQLKQVTQ